MNVLRNALIGGILVTVFLLFIQWNKFQEQKQVERANAIATQQQASDFPTAPEQSSNLSTDGSQDDLPQAPSDSQTHVESAVVATPEPSRALIHVKTDALNLKIDPVGGDIVSLSLPKHLAELDKPDSEFILLTQTPTHTYIAQSDLVGTNGTHYRNKEGQVERSVFSSARSNYVLNEGDETLVVDLTLTQETGAEIIKRFTFQRDSYLIDIEYIVNNKSDSAWKAAMYGRIKRDDYLPEVSGMFRLQPYLGAATRTAEDNYKKLDFEDLDKKDLKFEYEGGWIALVQHYFVGAWVPDQNQNNHYRLFRSSDKQHYLLQYTSPQLSVPTGQQGRINSKFYAGPKELERLDDIADSLSLTIDFGMLWFIAQPLFIVLDFIHDFVGNWGIAIILLTFFIKLVFLYPSAISYRSMAKMRKLMPKMQELKERYGDDRQKMGVETMNLYKKEGVNPLGGCLPMLLQMPVFMALYWMINEIVELRHSGFLWVEDLSYQDPLFIFPVVMGVIMYIQQKLNPPPSDPMQQKIFQFMPIGFTFILLFLPAALTLYMAVNTALSFVQQYLITKQIEKKS